MKKLSELKNSVLFRNMMGAFAIKGLSLCLSLFTMPAYIRYFNNQTVLGIWFTILSIISWLVFFDFGLGNGLRNLLPKYIENKDENAIKELISTTYVLMSIVAIIVFVIIYILMPYVDINRILNVEEYVVESSVLKKSIIIVLGGILIQFVAKLVDSILYALQKSAFVNLLTFISTLITVISLYIVPSTNTSENLIRMSYINVFAMLMPYVIASLIVFFGLLNRIYPSLLFFNFSYVKPVAQMGLSLMFLQIVFMVISSTNEYVISLFTTPQNVVEYQAYFKIFKTGAMIFSLALTPVWSAVTKAQVEHNYSWTIRIYKIFLKCSLACFALELLLVPFLGFIMDIWLGENYIQVNYLFGVIFACSGSIFVLHNVNTSIGNGISYFSLQIVWMGIAAIIDIPLSYLLVQATHSWIGVVLANILVLVPYNLLAPFYTIRKLQKCIE